MITQTYPILAGAAAVTALIGDNIYRVAAPQGSVAPYVVFGGVACDPVAYLDRTPDVDHDRVQVHAWADDFDTAAAIAMACRRALEPYGYMTGGYIEDQDPETKLWRVGFDWSLWTES